MCGGGGGKELRYPTKNVRVNLANLQVAPLVQDGQICKLLPCSQTARLVSQHNVVVVVVVAVVVVGGG